MKLSWTLLALGLALGGHAPAHAQANSDAFLLPGPSGATVSVGMGSGALDRILAAYQPPLAVDDRLTTFLSVDRGAALNVLCDSTVGVSSVLASLGEECLMRQLDTDSLGGFAAFSVRQQLLRADEHGFDLSFGLSWLQPSIQEKAHNEGLDLFSEQFAPSAGLLANADGQVLSIEGSTWIGERSWLRVTGTAGRYRIDSPLPALNGRWNRSTLGVQAGFGDFSGSLVGHRTGVNSLDRGWFDVDLGLSWRTPWSGKVTVGARNLLNRPMDVPAATVSGKAAVMEESRTPYVRYQQDL